MYYADFVLNVLHIWTGNKWKKRRPRRKREEKNINFLCIFVDILQQAAQLESLNSICSFCSRMKRGRIYAAARREGYNVLAFGQHLDDLAESFVMSIFHNGRLRTMKAHYTVKYVDPLWKKMFLEFLWLCLLDVAPSKLDFFIWF